MSKRLSGSIVALVTPFRNGKIGEESLETLVTWHCNEGTNGIVVCGSTGEGNLLNNAEKIRIIDIVRRITQEHLPLIVACGQPSTYDTIDLIHQAKKQGADAVLVVNPFYVKPSQEGLYNHFKTIHDTVDLPIILYNHPGRSGVDLHLETVLRLAELPRIIGIKDSNLDLTRPVLLRKQVKEDFSILCGDDPIVAAYLAHGGHGCVSVTANVAPRLCRELIDAWVYRDIEDFERLRDMLMPLHLALISETNPCPVKHAVSLLGKCQDEVRLPLLPASEPTQKTLKQVMENLGLFENFEKDFIKTTIERGFIN